MESGNGERRSEQQGDNDGCPNSIIWRFIIRIGLRGVFFLTSVSFSSAAGSAAFIAASAANLSPHTTQFSSWYSKSLLNPPCMLLKTLTFFMCYSYRLSLGRILALFGFQNLCPPGVWWFDNVKVPLVTRKRLSRVESGAFLTLKGTTLCMSSSQVWTFLSGSPPSCFLFIFTLMGCFLVEPYVEKWAVKSIVGIDYEMDAISGLLFYCVNVLVGDIYHSVSTFFWPYYQMGCWQFCCYWCLNLCYCCLGKTATSLLISNGELAVLLLLSLGAGWWYFAVDATYCVLLILV